MEVSSSSRGVVVMRETPGPGGAVQIYSYNGVSQDVRRSRRATSVNPGESRSWALCRLNRRGLRGKHYGDRLEILGRFLTSAGAVLLEHLAAMVAEEVALLRAELGDVEG